jgi:hypothetical protein
MAIRGRNGGKGVMSGTETLTAQELVQGIVDSLGEGGLTPSETPVVVYDHEGTQLEVTKVYEDLHDKALVIEVGPPIQPS